MFSSKFLVVFCVLVNLQFILAGNCESANCVRCVELIREDNLASSLDELKEFCIENADKIIEENQQPEYDVSLRTYNLTEKMNEVLNETDRPETSDNFHKSILIEFDTPKEYNLLPSLGTITQNDPNQSPLGTPIQTEYLGKTSLTEEQFLNYLETLNLDEFKDENFDEHLNEITNYLLSN